jgi:hypothetical protein
MGTLSAVSGELGPLSVDPKPGLEPEERDGASRITPVMPIPEWLREPDECENRHPTNEPDSDESEHSFWNTPPRYSVAGLSLAPARLFASSPRWRLWSARVLFSAILCVVVALLGIETVSLVRGALAARRLVGLQEATRAIGRETRAVSISHELRGIMQRVQTE